ncbi:MULTISPECIES: type II secretion system protein GspL [unclassified Iodidimonas]|jgi:general secretion pathway protein L|uniref:type II secretion system protein GspL n=1 Tax=unclassified Iodidimonas TaxID=2626145 RepID=UPI0024823625|nr:MULTISPECIES: type II secretion system protein GspL [unclassified Iodidimonas]
MTSTLLIRLPASPDDPVDWIVMSDAPPPESLACDDLAKAAAAADRIIALVPGSDVASRFMALPPARFSQMQAAAAIALDDDLAHDHERLHVALAPADQPAMAGDGPSRRLVLALSDRLMAGWIARLHDCGVTPHLMLPDYLALASGQSEKEVQIFADGQMMIVALGPDDGFAIEAEHLIPVLKTHPWRAAMLAQGGGGHLHLYGDDRAGEQAGAGAKLARDLADLLPDGWEIDHAPTPLSFLDHLRKRGVEGAAANLLQGPYRRASAFLPDMRALRLLAGLLALVFFGHGLWLYLDGQRYAAEADAAFVRAEAVFSHAMPDQKRIINPRAQLDQERSRLMAAGGGAGFLRLAGLLVDALAQKPGLQLVMMRYDHESESLHCDLVYQGFDDLEALKASIEAGGGVLEDGGVRQSGDRIEGSVVIRMAL